MLALMLILRLEASQPRTLSPSVWGQDPNVIAAYATSALALLAAVTLVVNAVLAFLTRRGIQATQNAAEATRVSAEATKEAAEAAKAEAVATLTQASAATDAAKATHVAAAAAADQVRELQRTREMEWRPFVNWKIGGGAWVEAANFGRGPALNTVFFVVDTDSSWRGSPLEVLCDLSPNQEIKQEDQILVVERRGTAPPRPQVASGTPRAVAFCEDQLGNRYRFIRGRVEPDIWTRGAGMEKPDWVTWYESNANIEPAL
ncbi:MAG TPA: hypothetical protein VG015_04240 [Candidatus Dormibacteraeota bacterium]|jgi:hypothetical protein|nr:hypothetical protein [Candidatus Dormibacteraeota bacterium]